MTNAAAQSPATTRVAGRAARLVAVEEAFMTPAILEAASRRAGGRPSMRSGPIAGPFMPDLLDLGAERVAAMDAAGIDVQLLAVAAPGVQHLDDDIAGPLAAEANDRLAEAVRAFPGRFAGMATIPVQTPEAAAREVVRAVQELGFRGVMVNSHTRGRYLDDERCRPILEAIEAMDVPLYIHPRDPAEDLDGAVIPGFTVGWAYAVETGTHLVRLMAGGVLDRFPRLRIVVGHLGECIPFLLDRMDGRYPFEAAAAGAPALPRTPGEYFRDQIWVATSGMNFPAPLRAVIDILGPERVLFAADHPFEDQREAVDAFAAIPLTADERRAIAHENAERLFRL